MSLSTFEDIVNLLQQDQLTQEQIQRWLGPVGFADLQAAYRSLSRIARDLQPQQDLVDRLLAQLLLALADTANPNQVLINFERFIHETPHQVELLHDFAGNPRTLEILFRLFEGSQFLTEILLRQPYYFERLIVHHRLAQPKSAHQLQTEAQAAVAHLLAADQDSNQVTAALDELRRFQRWELLRIGSSDLLGSFDLPNVTTQLSYLADSLVQASLSLAARQANTQPDDFFVVAMGKLGGEELNYSSDIDLLFIAGAEPMAYRQLGQHLIDNLTRMTAEGFLYRVDMRLRPWGSTGPLVSSLDGYLAYLERHARLWEKQALLKARVIAGNQRLGQEFLHRIQPLLFDTTPEAVRNEVLSLKQRIETQLRQRGRDQGEVKLGQGSIRDIEFVTQYLQLIHGANYPEVRNRTTLKALTRLFSRKFLTPDEYRVLTDGYIFLRTIEHHLQLMHYQQTHTLPEDKEALNHLAWRLGFQGDEVGSRFIARYRQHSAIIRLVYQQQLGLNGDQNSNHHANQANSKAKASASPYLLPYMARMSASYIATFSEDQLKHHARLAEDLDNDVPVKVEAVPLDDQHWQVTIVGYDYLGELSVICGLLFVYGFNILQGHVFSYEPSTEPSSTPHEEQWRPQRRQGRTKGAGIDTRPRIVDVFTVAPTSNQALMQQWTEYEQDLVSLVRRLQAGQQREVQGELAKRVAVALHHIELPTATLYPIDIEVNNDASRHYTLLRIDAPDTIGFLYELSNALALSDINIGHVVVETKGNRVRDVLYVTDRQERKILDAAKQNELRAAIALIKQFTHLLPNSPNPEAALLHFREFVGQLFTRSNWTEELVSLRQPEVLNRLARLLGGSDFLWDDFLRMQHANLFPVIQNIDALTRRKSKNELWQELETILQTTSGEAAQRDALNAFKDREMFRIDMRQIQRQIEEFGEFSGELTDLAEVVVEGAYHICWQELRTIYGVPTLANGRPCPLSICALGKSGGRELGFASDIELMFIYQENGQTSGSRVISNAEFYDKLVQTINGAIRTKREGIFEVDLRLRPYGKAGNMAVSLESFQRYFAPGGDAWPYERQALVKLRPIGGDVKLGQQIVKLRDEFIYNGQPFDVAAMRAMRERQIRHYVTAGTIQAKLSPGGLVDIEYLVQGLQMTYGHLNPGLRLTNTREAMRALHVAGILSPDDYVPLEEAHHFLRALINALRMVRGNAKDLTTPPADSEEFAFLARRLNYSRENRGQLQHDLIHHMTRVQEINSRLLDSPIKT